MLISISHKETQTFYLVVFCDCASLFHYVWEKSQTCRSRAIHCLQNVIEWRRTLKYVDGKCSFSFAQISTSTVFILLTKSFQFSFSLKLVTSKLICLPHFKLKL